MHVTSIADLLVRLADLTVACRSHSQPPVAVRVSLLIAFSSKAVVIQQEIKAAVIRGTLPILVFKLLAQLIALQICTKDQPVCTCF